MAIPTLGNKKITDPGSLNPIQDDLGGLGAESNALPTFDIQTDTTAKKSPSYWAIEDIKRGMPMEEFDNLYPELLDKKNSFASLSIDLAAGMPESEIANLYPELLETTSDIFKQDKQKAIKEAQATGQAYTNVTKSVGGYIGGVGGEIIESIRETGKDIFRQTHPEKAVSMGVKPEGILGAMGEQILDNIKGFKGSAERLKKGQQGKFDTFMQMAAESTDIALTPIREVFVGVLDNLTPDTTEEQLKAMIRDVAATEVGKKAIGVAQDINKKYEETKKTDPGLAGNLRASAKFAETLLDLAGVGLVKGAGKKVAKETVEQTGKETVIPTLGQIVKKDIKGIKEVPGKIKETIGEGIKKGQEKLGKINVKGKTKIIGEEAKVAKEQITSGLTKEQIKGFQSNPYQANEFNKLVNRLDSPEGISDIKDYKVERVGAITKELTDEIDKVRATKGETSKIYKFIREETVKVPTKPLLTDLKATFKRNGLSVKKGEVIRLKGIKAGELNQADVSKINQLYQDLVFDATKQKGSISASQTLNLRKTASDLAKYDAASTTTGQKIMRAIRKSIDTHAKTTIPGLKKLDKHFVDKLNEFESAVKDLVYKGGDVKGEWRSNIVNIIGTLDRANRAKLLKRLDDVVPGIGEKIQAVDNIPTIFKSLQNKGALEKFTGTGGAFIGATSLGSVLPVIGHIAGAILGFAGGKVLEATITGARKVALNKILSKISKEGLKRMKEIDVKIATKQTLNEADKKFVNSLKQQFKNETTNIPVNNSTIVTPKSRDTRSSINNSNSSSKILIKTPKKVVKKKVEKGYIETQQAIQKRKESFINKWKGKLEGKDIESDYEINKLFEDWYQLKHNKKYTGPDITFVGETSKKFEKDFIPKIEKEWGRVSIKSDEKEFFELINQNVKRGFKTHGKVGYGNQQIYGQIEITNSKKLLNDLFNTTIDKASIPAKTQLGLDIIKTPKKPKVIDRGKTLGLTTKENKAVLDKFGIKCAGGNCGKKAIEEYKKHGMKGEIKSGKYMQNIKTKEEALELAKSPSFKGVKNQHIWHELDGKVTEDIYPTTSKGIYVTDKEIANFTKKKVIKISKK